MKYRMYLSVLAAGGLLLIFGYTRRLNREFEFQEQPGSLFLSPFPNVINTTTVDKTRMPLSTLGRDIVDPDGNRVKLASINWYGASDELFIPSGLDVQHRDHIAAVIRHMGFNSVRLPYSDEMVMDNPLPSADLLLANEDLMGLRALDIYVAVVESLTEAGIMVIPNNHITQATWCCGINLCDTAWSNDYLGAACRVRQTEEQWMKNWEMVMENFVSNPLVIGADLRNEPRGLWGTMPWSKWATAAEKAGNRLLAMRSDWLIFVEGVSSSNDLSEVGSRPVVLDVPARVVYSAHVYSWSGWGSLDGMYAKRPYPSFAASMHDNWAYLLERNIAPVWVGEFGCPHLPGPGDLHYWRNLMEFLKAVDADFGYWALNPRKPHNFDNETYGLLEDDWETPILDYRMRDMLQLSGQKLK
jgi:endoglucanase